MAKEKIETLAVLDYLTLLPNRSGLYSFYFRVINSGICNSHVSGYR